MFRLGTLLNNEAQPLPSHPPPGTQDLQLSTSPICPPWTRRTSCYAQPLSSHPVHLPILSMDTPHIVLRSATSLTFRPSSLPQLGHAVHRATPSHFPDIPSICSSSAWSAVHCDMSGHFPHIPSICPSSAWTRHTSCFAQATSLTSRPSAHPQHGHATHCTSPKPLPSHPVHLPILNMDTPHIVLRPSHFPHILSICSFSAMTHRTSCYAQPLPSHPVH